MKKEDQNRAAAREAELLGPGLIHEMRHPLLGIKAGLDLIARRLGNQVTSLEDWELVATQVARLEELFRSYQQLFTPDTAGPSRFTLEPVIQRAVDLLAYRIRKLGGRFEWTRGEAHVGLGSQNSLLHAVVNLLANALDAVEGAGKAARIAVRVLERPLQIRISDEGSGIAPGDAARIFEPRFTTKPEGEGQGLGLHIAREAMLRAGGDVRLVAADDPLRLPWARTEFAVEIAQP